MLITGGAGFIGSNFVRFVLTYPNVHIVAIDKLTYAGHLHNIQDILKSEPLTFIQADITEQATMEHIFETYRPQYVINFAAETHVDRSIDKPEAFIHTNIGGTFVLLEAARTHWRSLPDHERVKFRFLQVSTDEVYGTLGEEGYFSEDLPYAPNSPYAASKASADHLARAYWQTYGLPILITNSSNNYGPYQFPEKLIPLMLLNAHQGKPLPIYGEGKNIRDWIFVHDHCEGLYAVLTQGRVGETYHLGGNNERTNLETVESICRILEELDPASYNLNLQKQGLVHYRDLVTFVSDRPGHDLRYAMDTSKIRHELGWTPKHDFLTGLKKTVQWYLTHRDWCTTVTSGNYQGERLGLKQTPL